MGGNIGWRDHDTNLRRHRAAVMRQIDDMDSINRGLIRGSEAHNALASRVGATVIRAVPEVADMSEVEIMSWAHGMVTMDMSSVVIPSLADGMTNTDIVGLFWRWLRPQLVGDCVPNGLAWEAYVALCGRFGLPMMSANRRFSQVFALVAAEDGWIVPPQAASSKMGLYDWVVRREPIVDMLVNMARRGESPFSCAAAERINDLCAWYPSVEMNHPFVRIRGIVRSDAYEFCNEMGTTPRAWIVENVIGDVAKRAVEMASVEGRPNNISEREARLLESELARGIARNVDSGYFKFREAVEAWFACHGCDVGGEGDGAV